MLAAAKSPSPSSLLVLASSMHTTGFGARLAVRDVRIIESMRPRFGGAVLDALSVRGLFTDSLTRERRARLFALSRASSSAM